MLERYLSKEIDRLAAQTLLGIKKTQLFKLIKAYRKKPEAFSVTYKRTTPNNRTEPALTKHLLAELKKEQEMIANPKIPLRTYNYTYIQQLCADKQHEKVSLPTVIAIAKKEGFFLPKRERKAHDREVVTHYAGELLQHDTSFHLFAPYADQKWYLLTTLDDYSRMLLYARLVLQETTWAHIMAFQHVCVTQGIPMGYYVDNHSIFRFVQGRDSRWRTHALLTDDADPQWKQVLRDLRVRVTYALSPEAKGKIERPYRWLQDRLVRTCARERITRIEEAQKVLELEEKRYNYHQVHSTTGEIPAIRFERALRGKHSLFREFTIPYPYQSLKDIFCLRIKRTVDGYRMISINNLKLRIHNTPLHHEVDVRITPDDTNLCEARIWYNGRLTDVYRLKTADLKGVHF